jgi:hypothetical protein
MLKESCKHRDIAAENDEKRDRHHENVAQPRLATLFSLASLVLATNLALAQNPPSATAPYQISTFAQGVTGTYTQPDSIAVLGGRIFIGYGNGVAKDGSDNGSSTIVEYRTDGSLVQMLSVKGHNDGLKINPSTGALWALENEDGNPSLVIIDTATGLQTTYSFETTEHGGGYDDIVFRNGSIFISASNPGSNPNTAPAIVSATLVGRMVQTNAVLAGNATALDIPTNQPTTLNLQDPDSMILAPNGDILLDSQDDAELIIVQHAGEGAQRVLHLPFSSGGMQAKADDTIIATSSDGFLLVSDLNANTVYRVDSPYWPNGAAYTAAIANSVGLVGQLDFLTGNLTPVVSGLTNPRGMAFVLSEADRSTIGVLDATYGASCGAPTGNVTADLVAMCGGLSSCSYTVDYHRLGDPAPNCWKNYSARWQCGLDPTIYSVAAPGEAGFGSVVTLSCGR